MDKLSRFYLELSMDTDKLEKFNRGQSIDETSENRKEMLNDAGIEHSDKIIALTQSQLSILLSASIYSITGDYVNSVLKLLATEKMKSGTVLKK